MARISARSLRVVPSLSRAGALRLLKCDQKGDDAGRNAREGNIYLGPSTTRYLDDDSRFNVKTRGFIDARSLAERDSRDTEKTVCFVQLKV